MSNLLIDTNAYSAFMKGNAGVSKALLESDTIFLSVFVVGELFTGFRGGTREVQNREQLNRFIQSPSVEFLPTSLATADIYSELKRNLRMAGTPIPENDVWIAAHALEHGAILVTLDKHFSHISNLRLWKFQD